MSFKQFIIRFTFGYFALLSVIGIFNFIVDPGWYFRAVEIENFNAVKPGYIDFAHDVKPALLASDQPEAIILGSSYSEIGFDPTNPNFTDNGRLKSMNFAFAKAHWGEVQCDFEYAVNHSNIKRALVGLHPGNLPISNCEKNHASIGEFYPVDILFTYSALEYSYKTLTHQKERDATHSREGMFYYNRNKNPTNFFRQDLRSRNSFCKNKRPLKSTGRSKLDKTLDLSGLERMIRSAKEHDIELVFYVYPRHAFWMELDGQCRNQEVMWLQMKQIKEFIDSESRGQYPSWQFFGYNNVFAQPVRKTRGLWQDAKHFNFEVGNLMLSDMFDNSKPPNYARPLDMKYSDFLNERKAYLIRHPNFKAEMRKVFN